MPLAISRTGMVGLITLPSGPMENGPVAPSTWDVWLRLWMMSHTDCSLGISAGDPTAASLMATAAAVIAL